MPLQSAAQNWLASDHAWTYSITGGFAGVNDLFTMHAGADTAINGQTCKKVLISGSSINYPENRFAYADGDRMYAYQEYSDSFALLYDFSLPAGSVLIVPKHFSSVSYLIESVDTVQAGPLNRRRQRAVFLNTDGTPSDWRFDILEGIGMVGQPFQDTLPTCSYFFIDQFDFCGSPVDGFDLKFVCFRSNAGNFTPYNLDCLLLDTDAPEQLGSVNIGPNPAVDLLYLEAKDLPARPLQTRLFNAQGQLLRSDQGLPEQIHLETFGQGVYFLLLELENGQRLLRRFVKT